MKNNGLREKLKSYHSKVEEWEEFKKSKQGTQFNKEQNTVIKFVVPLLEILGWKCFSAEVEVEFEYFIKKGGRVDVALYTQNKEIPKILIEVKPIQDDIRNAATQMFRSYLVNSQVHYGITTNGKSLMLFDKFRVRRQYQRARLLFGLNSKDFVQYNGVLSVLSKDSVTKGLLDGLVDAYHHREYWEWRKINKKKHAKNILPLIFAREFLRNNRIGSNDILLNYKMREKYEI